MARKNVIYKQPAINNDLFFYIILVIYGIMENINMVQSEASCQFDDSVSWWLDGVQIGAWQDASLPATSLPVFPHCIQSDGPTSHSSQGSKPIRSHHCISDDVNNQFTHLRTCQKQKVCPIWCSFSCPPTSNMALFIELLLRAPCISLYTWVD